MTSANSGKAISVAYMSSHLSLAGLNPNHHPYGLERTEMPDDGTKRQASKKERGCNYRMGGEMAFLVIQSVLDDLVLFSVDPWLVADYGEELEDLLGPTRPELVALMHLSSGRREDELQGFASLREMLFGTMREECKE
ncbi:hypothetical protein BTVI_148880 [Pitangus sulphuratus]|nr:hypothetical protein BTVI_148880 [Pitangus sulphuratus]